MTVIWFALILLCLLMYVIFDGYDLGIGIATLAERDQQHRREMLELVAVAWDGNETWLVLLGVSLWAGFPLAYGTILPHAFLPLITMLFALIVRGVAVEMASQRPPAPRWEKAFGIASLAAALAQGAAAGTLAANLHVTGDAYNGSAFGALSWYSAMTALAVAAGYLALGYAYLKWKAAGDLRVTASRRGTGAAAAAVILGAGCVGALNATAAPLNLDSPVRIAGFAGLTVFAAAGAALAVVTLRPSSRFDSMPMYGLAVAAVAVMLGVATARYPILVPPSLTADGAASPGATMEFIAVGIGLDVPLVLFYHWYAHYAFRGKSHGVPQGQPAESKGASDDR
jgi:cytochrome bd ubiquinol oxidase subunit II